MKWLKGIAFTLGGLIVFAVAFVAWILHTENGARWVAGTISNVMGAKLEIGVVDGALAGPLTLVDVRYRDAGAGVDLTAQRISIDISLRELMSLLVYVKHAELAGVNVLLSEGQQPPEPKEDKPFSLEPPIDLIVDSFTVSKVKVGSPEATLLEVASGAFAGRWTSEELAVQRLDVLSPQGEVHFAGHVAGQDTYVGESDGRFRWRVGEQTYAGALRSVAQGEHANLTLELTSPVNAALEASVQQTPAAPWRFQLTAPRFDPREQLMPGSSIASLAASLNGEGSLESGVVRGELLLNGETLVLEPLRFTRGEQQIAVDATLRIADSPGPLHAKARVNLGTTPAVAEVAAAWRDVVIPAVWAGQELHTGGQLDFSGNAAKYQTHGAVSVGPAQRIADVAFELEGASNEIRLLRFDVLQARGKLAANGRIQMKPQLAWRVSAGAQHFDPGAFAAAWRGALNFNLKSEGRVTDAGPTASVRLTDLSGELRGRRLSGAADLNLTPALVPSGTLALNSGQSELRFNGAPGDEIDATVSLDVASLNDWLPDGAGELKAAFVVRGRWPQLSVEGDARGRDLSAASVRAAALAVNADVHDPRNPEGAVQIEVNQLMAGGFEFATVSASASGGADKHALSVRATGSPLAFKLELQGARKNAGWSGSLQQLVFEVADAARLTLREPVQISAGQGAFEASRACLVDGAIELCASGAMRPDGSLQANYSMKGVPIGLANAFTSSDMPLRFAGVIQGQGDVRRSAEGEFFGNVLIEAPSGRVSRQVSVSEDDAPAEEQTLFGWRELRVAANLAGADARATVRAQFEQGGSVEGEGAIRSLGQAESPITGRVAATLPDLAPFGIFAPQIANLQGRADARFSVAGTLQSPHLTGELSATELGADVPAVGLHLKNGSLSAKPEAEGQIALSGGVASGEGRLAFAGRITPDGAVDVNVNGDRFLAADIPGARVVVTPDLKFVRANERMNLGGQVTIPEAVVNLQKLPRGGDRAQEASADVVVIDAKTREEETAEAPLFAEITVVLGDKVELTGFGLQAQVTGRLDVRESPGEPTVGSGEVRVAGRYKAYGQDLTIQEGKLLYASTPLDNPRLSIEATRQVEDVTAGLRVRGSAQDPELTIFSDPPMAQANALSYLVAGKPLEDIGAEEGEGDALQTATRSLGTAAGGLLAKNLGRRLGVDELAVKDDEMIGGSALTVGQYLSPRLYLSYGVGLFEPGEVVTLRYKISQDFDVKTQRGPEDTRAGIEYRIER